MSENIAPIRQLLVSTENIQEVVNKIYVKKSDIKDPRILDNLHHLCNVVEQDKRSSILKSARMLAVFEMRKDILENASEIYAENGEEELFDEHTNELEVILEVLKEYTLVK